MILVGALVLSPLVAKLPMLGWDWYFFFNLHNPQHNLLAPSSAYPPYSPMIIRLLTWMDWRVSLTLLHSLTLVTFAIATWQNGGRYGSIFLALLTPPVWYLLWIGHPDGLALLGFLIGFPPLALIKPQLTFFGLVSNKKLFAWTIVFLFITFILWPFWPLRMRLASFDHPTVFGWANTGVIVLLLGVLMLLGAGNSPYRLIASGLLISPYLTPYNLAILVPVFGQLQGWRKMIVWLFAWLTVFGVGLDGAWKIINLLYPVSAYCLSLSVPEYISNVKTLWNQGIKIFNYFHVSFLSRKTF